MIHDLDMLLSWHAHFLETESYYFTESAVDQAQKLTATADRIMQAAINRWTTMQFGGDE